MKKHIYASLCLLLTAGAAKAQTVSTFESLTLPGTDTFYYDRVNLGAEQHFDNGNVRLYATFEEFFWSGATYSNKEDSVTDGYANQYATRAGKGVFGSDKYITAYYSEYDNNVVKLKLLNAAAGKPVAGFYITNTTYAARYMEQTYVDGHWFDVIINGYLNGAQVTNNVAYRLAEVTATDTFIQKDWRWVDLTSLGNVDSLTFSVASSDAGEWGINTPTYFNIDNFVTTDGNPVCDTLIASATTNSADRSATISWQARVTALEYEIVVDQSAGAPATNGTRVTTTTYEYTNVQAGTDYYAHIRSICNGNVTSDWVHIPFRIEANGVPGITMQDAVAIYPNPARNLLNFKAQQTYTAQISNLQGQVLRTVSTKEPADISVLQPGIYIVRLVDANGVLVATGKITKL